MNFQDWYTQKTKTKIHSYDVAVQISAMEQRLKSFRNCAEKFILLRKKLVLYIWHHSSTTTMHFVIWRDQKKKGIQPTDMGIKSDDLLNDLIPLNDWPKLKFRKKEQEGER